MGDFIIYTLDKLLIEDHDNYLIKELKRKFRKIGLKLLNANNSNQRKILIEYTKFIKCYIRNYDYKYINNCETEEIIEYVNKIAPFRNHYNDLKTYLFKILYELYIQEVDYEYVVIKGLKDGENNIKKVKVAMDILEDKLLPDINNLILEYVDDFKDDQSFNNVSYFTQELQIGDIIQCMRDCKENDDLAFLRYLLIERETKTRFYYMEIKPYKIDHEITDDKIEQIKYYDRKNIFDGVNLDNKHLLNKGYFEKGMIRKKLKDQVNKFVCISYKKIN